MILSRMNSSATFSLKMWEHRCHCLLQIQNIRVTLVAGKHVRHQCSNLQVGTRKMLDIK